MKFVGINPVIVHGGGPEINYWLDKTGQTSQFVDGLRVQIVISWKLLRWF